MCKRECVWGGVCIFVFERFSNEANVCVCWQVYERLYHQGVVKVKRQQHMQEQKRLDDADKLRKERQQVFFSFFLFIRYDFSDPLRI